MKKTRYFFKALSLSIKLKTPTSFFVGILGLAMAFLPMIIALQLERFTNYSQDLFGHPDNILKTIRALLLLLLIYSIQALFNYVQEYYNEKDSLKVTKYLKTEMLELLSTIPYKYIENYNNFKEKYEMVNTFASSAATGSIAMIFTWFSNIIAFLSVSWVIFKVSPLIMWILILTSIPAVILSMCQKDETYRFRTKFMKEGLFVLTYSEDCRKNEPMKEIRFLGLYPYLKEKWFNLGKLWVNKKNKIIKKHVIINGISDILRNGVYLFIVFLTAKDIYKNPELGIGVLVLILTSAERLQKIVTNLLINTIKIFSDIRYIEDFFSLFETERESMDDTCEIYEKIYIDFKDVSFNYPNSNVKALDKINVKINPGEKIAIVGANGSGKSTFINILCGMYKPTSGSAKINGMEISENISSVRKSTSVVFQAFCQYQDTIRSNIDVSWGNDMKKSDKEIKEIMKKTGADEILNIDNDLDEVLGLFSENGRNLSGGQWQKIAVSRALIKKEAALFILDEPTSALDPISEAHIYKNFASLTENKTTVLVSHRLGIASIVDRILVFDKGRIVEDGNFEKLIKQNGFFAKMYYSQSKWYLEN